MRAIYTEEQRRIFYPNEPTTEAEYETQLLRCFASLFPEFRIAVWKPTIQDPYGRAAKPDMILVERDFGSWYVVEVELARHDVSGHVVPQLETLGAGIYDTTLLTSIRQALGDYDDDRLNALVYKQPGRLCIADSYTERLQIACRIMTSN